MSERPVNGRCGKRIADFQYCDLHLGHGGDCGGTQHFPTESELSAALALRTEAIAEHIPNFSESWNQASCACGWQHLWTEENEGRSAKELWQAHIRSLSPEVERKALEARIAEAKVEMFDLFWDAAAAMGVSAGKYTPQTLLQVIITEATKELREALQEADGIVSQYAQETPKWTHHERGEQDPLGAHAWITKARALLGATERKAPEGGK